MAPEFLRKNPELVGYYKELEEKYGIKVCWYRDGEYRLPQRGELLARDETIRIMEYISYPALVDSYHLNTDRLSFWIEYGGVSGTNRELGRIFRLNRLRANMILGVTADLWTVGVEWPLDHVQSKRVGKTVAFLRGFIRSLKDMGDGYPENVTLGQADIITDKLIGVCWALRRE